MSEISGVETHNVFGHTRRPRAESQEGKIEGTSFAECCVPKTSHHVVPVPGTDGLQHPHGRRGATLEALTDVVGVGPGPILKQHLSGFAGPGQRLQKVLHLVSGATTGLKKKKKKEHLQNNRQRLGEWKHRMCA